MPYFITVDHLHLPSGVITSDRCHSFIQLYVLKNEVKAFNNLDFQQGPYSDRLWEADGSQIPPVEIYSNPELLKTQFSLPADKIITRACKGF